MSGSTSNTQLPVVMTAAGPQPVSPATWLQYLTNLVQLGTDPNGNSVVTPNPDYTNTLPGSLIEDISSTDVAALVLCDSARVELINSLTPYGANPYLLTQLGNIYGVPLGAATNTSVSVVFSGPAGYIIPVGFVVSDGTQQYTVQDGGVIQTGGQSQPLFCLAVNTGSWAVPLGTVTTTVTSVPVGVTLTCTNPEAGTPGTGAETVQDYRSRVLQAGLVACQGSPAFLKTQLLNIPGVQSNQVSVRQATSTGWEVICGGGDSYAIANAIWESLPDLSMVVGSTLAVTAITQANPGVVTTDINHLFATGQVVTFSGVGGMTALNTGNYTITVITETTFSIGVNTSGYPAYTSGGVVSPNLRNVTVNINNYPDTYAVTFVRPPQQTVNVTLVWNTIAANFVASSSINQLGQTAIITYLNTLAVGQPINLFVLQDQVLSAWASVLASNLISQMTWTFQINSVTTPPQTGTGLVYGDPESYFYATPATVSVSQV